MIVLAIPSGATAEDPTGKLAGLALDSDERFLALNLLRDVAASDFKLPFAEIITSTDHSIIAAALQLALERRERLPVDALLKLLSSPNNEAAQLAAMNLGYSASLADLPRIEAIAKKLSSKWNSATPANQYHLPVYYADIGQRGLVIAELWVSISKINARDQIESADSKSRSAIIKKLLSDPQIGEWIWSQHAREELEGPAQEAAATTLMTGSAQKKNTPSKQPGSDSISAGEAPDARALVLPFGENLFPSDVGLYAAFPDLSAALNKLDDALTGIQMDSARGQANFALMLRSLKEAMARSLGAPPGSPTLNHFGVKPAAPLALASWTAEGAPRGLASAQRQAIVVRVSDRDRFERLLALYQNQIGDFGYLPQQISLGARFIGFAPAIFPPQQLQLCVCLSERQEIKR